MNSPGLLFPSTHDLDSATKEKVCLVEHSNGDGGVTLKTQARSSESLQNFIPA